VGSIRDDVGPGLAGRANQASQNTSANLITCGDQRIDDLGRRHWHQPRARPL